MTRAGSYQEDAYYSLLVKELGQLRRTEQRLHNEIGEIQERLNTMKILVYNCRPQTTCEEPGDHTTSEDILKKRDEASKAKFEAERLEDAMKAKAKCAAERRFQAAKDIIEAIFPTVATGVSGFGKDPSFASDTPRPSFNPYN